MNNPVTQTVRHFSIALLIAVVIGQWHLLEHEIEHLISGDHDSCVVCEIAEHQGDAIVGTLPENGPTPQLTAWIVQDYSFHNRHTSFFSPRAPPFQTTF